MDAHDLQYGVRVMSFAYIWNGYNQRRRNSNITSTKVRRQIQKAEGEERRESAGYSREEYVGRGCRNACFRRACRSTIPHRQVPHGVHHVCRTLRRDLEQMRIHNSVRGEQPFYSSRLSRWPDDEHLGATVRFIRSKRKPPKLLEAADEIFLFCVPDKSLRRLKESVPRTKFVGA